jgi:hypothetical protein
MFSIWVPRGDKRLVCSVGIVRSCGADDFQCAVECEGGISLSGSHHPYATGVGTSRGKGVGAA